MAERLNIFVTKQGKKGTGRVSNSGLHYGRLRDYAISL